MEQKWSNRLIEAYGRLALWYSLGATTKEDAKVEIKNFTVDEREYNEVIQKIDTLWK
jgi:hypothetical protein